MTDKTIIRRKLLKSLAAGTGAAAAGNAMPESWTKPVLDTVVLPSHARTTDDSGSSPGMPTTTPACCLIQGDYCGEANNQDTIQNGVGLGPLWVNVNVAVNGLIKVQVNGDLCGWYEGSTAIACTGDEFTITANYNDAQCAAPQGDSINIDIPPAIELKGTVGCSATSIAGTVSFNQQSLSYTAYPNQCD